MKFDNQLGKKSWFFLNKLHSHLFFEFNCKGKYQEDWTEWIQKYELEAGTGRWLKIFDYW